MEDMLVFLQEKDQKYSLLSLDQKVRSVFTYVTDRFPSHVFVLFPRKYYHKMPKYSPNKLCYGFNMLGCHSSS